MKKSFIKHSLFTHNSYYSYVIFAINNNVQKRKLKVIKNVENKSKYIKVKQ